MTLRPGSFDANWHHVDWRGVIRDDSAPWWYCTHRDHASSRQARQCAAEALAQYRKDATMPPDWVTYNSREEVR